MRISLVGWLYGICMIMNIARIVSFGILLLFLFLWKAKGAFRGKFMGSFSLNRSVIPFNYTYFIYMQINSL